VASNYPLWVLMLCLAGATPALARTAADPGSDLAARTEGALMLIESGRQALLADKYVEASEALEAAMELGVFQRLQPAVQHQAFLIAAFAASGRDDYLGAHEFMMAATEFDEANAAQWLLRARYASWVEEWADAALAITTVARRWAGEIAKDEHRELISQIGYRLRKDDRRHREYLDLLNALFDARYTAQFGIQPDGFWQDLVLDALEKGDMKRARTFAARIENTDTLLRMRIDKRFDALVRDDAKRFDLTAAMKRRSRSLARVVTDEPRSLQAFVQYGYALLDEGRYTDLLERSDVILRRIGNAPAKSPPYDDLDDSLNWVYNHKAASLRALGRWDEALGVMEAGRAKREHGSDNVSQAINLGFHYNDAGQAQKALDVLEDVDWARALSPYGRMQLQHVRYRAYLHLGNHAEADNVLAYLREHHDDADDTWLQVLLDSDDVDGAAAQLIAQLKDAEKRGAALAGVQDYRRPAEMPLMRDSRERWNALLARADVSAAIDEVGRRERQPLYRTPD
jgi:hypothetical protein